MKYRNLTLEYLESLPTLSVGQADDLKIDNGDTRVWLSRMTIDDGMEYDNQVTIEKYREATTRGEMYHSKRWVTDYTYQAK